MIHHQVNRDMTKPTKYCAPSEDSNPTWASVQSNQSLRCPNEESLGLATHKAHNEDSDQTGRMPRLTCVFAGRTVTLLVLSCRGSGRFKTQAYLLKQYVYSNKESMCQLMRL